MNLYYTILKKFNNIAQITLYSIITTNSFTQFILTTPVLATPLKNEVSSPVWSFTITEHPTLTFDGKTYTSIKIGNHRWLQQNLNSANHPIVNSRCYEDESYNWYAAENIASQFLDGICQVMKNGKI